MLPQTFLQSDEVIKFGQITSQLRLDKIYVPNLLVK